MSAASFLPDINTRRPRTRPRVKKDPVPPDRSSWTTETVSKEDIALFRNSLKQNICVEMLREGYHRSFSEFFSLLRSAQDRRLAAGPGSAIWLQTPLEEQPDKLQMLQQHLSQAEQAERTGSWSAACEQRSRLARFFSSPEDRWLSFHFYRRCLDLPHAEASAAAAEAYLEQGLLEEAKEQAERSSQQTEAGCWVDSAGRPLRLQDRRTLWRIYSRLASRDDTRALALLGRGYSLATDSGDQRTEGEAAYRLGLAYQCVGDHVTAKKFLTMYMEISSTLQDADGLGKAYKAMAKSMESEGRLDETVQYLEKFADISGSNKLQHNLQDACMCLGNIYYTTGRCEAAAECFQKACDTSCHLGEAPLLQRAQALLGSARAHSLIRKYSADVELATPPALRRLLAWKETREQQATNQWWRGGDEEEDEDQSVLSPWEHQSEHS